MVRHYKEHYTVHKTILIYRMKWLNISLSSRWILDTKLLTLGRKPKSSKGRRDYYYGSTALYWALAAFSVS
jgi:hypothetical protein